MKKAFFLTISFLLITFLSRSQTIKGIDYISPFNDGVSAIKKDNQWAFVNTKGDILIDFRDDLVVTKTADGNYPVFNSERCLIKQKKEGIPYYGYIDASGKTIITPQFLNATHFKNNKAIALELVKVDMGRSQSLDKDIYKYKYFEVVIDTKGQIKNYLTDAVYIGLSSTNLIKAPVITSQFISEASNLIATKGKNKKYSVKNIDTKNRY